MASGNERNNSLQFQIHSDFKSNNITIRLRSSVDNIRFFSLHY